MKVFKALWGFFFIFIGVVLLLNSAFNLSWGIWAFIWQFWPLLLVLFGLAFILEFKKINYWLGMTVLLGVFCLAGIGLFFSWQHKYFDTQNYSQKDGEVSEEKISADYPSGTKEVKLNLNTGASNVKIAGDEAQAFLYQGKHLSNFFNLSQNLSVTGEKASLLLKTTPVIKTIFQPKSVNDLDLTFSGKPVYDLEIKTGASNIDLNLELLKTKKIDLESGASKIMVRFGKKENVRAEVDAGASSINLYVPKQSGLRITISSVLVSNNFEDIGLIKHDSEWTSTDWDKRSHQIDVDINAGASSVKIIQY